MSAISRCRTSIFDLQAHTVSLWHNANSSCPKLKEVKSPSSRNSLPLSYLRRPESLALSPVASSSVYLFLVHESPPFWLYKVPFWSYELSTSPLATVVSSIVDYSTHSCSSVNSASAKFAAHFQECGIHTPPSCAATSPVDSLISMAAFSWSNCALLPWLLSMYRHQLPIRQRIHTRRSWYHLHQPSLAQHFSKDSSALSQRASPSESLPRHTHTPPTTRELPVEREHEREIRDEIKERESKEKENPGASC